jgi:lipopolysaccharide/colanic/teichoic acid biosynthesis glycosyltransferase
MGSRRNQSDATAQEQRASSPGRLLEEFDSVTEEFTPDVASDYFCRSFRWQFWAAVILAILTLPVLLMAMMLVRLTSPGPAIYRQTRVGLHGRLFRLLKIRTMNVDAEASTGAVWTTSLEDPRITPVGRVLRWTHIDELPQLWNVLRGEMALVGPRPERPEFTGMLAQSLPGYLERLVVRPGVTGLAQVNLPADSDVESVAQETPT